MFPLTFGATVGRVVEMGQKLMRFGRQYCGAAWEALSYGVDVWDHNEPTSSVYPEWCGSQITMTRLHH